MTANPRRPAFRLPWTGEADESTEARADATLTAGSEQPAEANGTTVHVAAEGQADAGESAPVSEPEPSVAPEAAESSEFLQSLMSAMRSVAETSRETSLGELRQSVEERIEELKAGAAEQADELRRLADQDIAAVEEWEKAEQERVRAEAERRRESRRAQLGRQLAEHQAANQREMEETRRRLAEHERELAGFFAQLGDIADPTAFVAAAKRVPRPPELARSTPMATPAPPIEASEETATAGASAVEEPAWPDINESEGGRVDTRLAERLAELDARLADGEPETAAAAPAAAPVAVTSGEASTAIVVKGLGSFGAITSFKQALERIEGIKGVTLSLGPTGEFVYRASHAAEFDLAGAIRTVEGPSATIDEAEGSLLVTVNRGR